MKSNKENMNKTIDILDISIETLEILKNNSIYFIYELIRKSKSSLKQMGIKTEQINMVQIQLQLIGLELNMKG